MTSAAIADGPQDGAEALIDFLSRVPKVALNCWLPYNDRPPSLFPPSLLDPFFL